MTLNRCLLCLLLLAVLNICQGQTMSADSLKAILPNAKEDTAKVDMLITISRSYLSSEPQQAIPYAMEAQELAKKLVYEKGLAMALKKFRHRVLPAKQVHRGARKLECRITGV